MIYIMKTINEYFLQSEKVSLISEYLLSKTKRQQPQSNDKAKKELVNKLYNEFGKQYGNFEKITTNGTFYETAENIDEIKHYIPSEIVDLASVTQGPGGEYMYEWNIDDIIKFYNYDYLKVYSLINDWFDYL